MKTQRSLSFALSLALASALAPLQSAHADAATNHISLEDPSKPATLRIRLWHGEVRVHGADVKDITVVTDSSVAEPPPRADGMRVLSDSPNFRFSESHNVVSLEYGESGEPADIDLTVPKQTSVIVANSIRGDFECAGLSGDIDVRTMDGAVKADDVSGGVCIESMNGQIDVNMSALAASKPLCLSSMNGQITIRVPASSKATVNFRTHHGAILTNFDDKALVTRTDLVRHNSSAEERNYRRDLAARGSADSESANSDSDGDLHAEIRDTIREATDQAALAARDAANAVHESLAEVHAELSKLPPLPPMTGGKVVSGSLNGGGVDIQAASLNGDIILKKGN